MGTDNKYISVEPVFNLNAHVDESKTNAFNELSAQQDYQNNYVTPQPNFDINSKQAKNLLPILGYEYDDIKDAESNNNLGTVITKKDTNYDTKLEPNANQFDKNNFKLYQLAVYKKTHGGFNYILIGIDLQSDYVKSKCPIEKDISTFDFNLLKKNFSKEDFDSLPNECKIVFRISKDCSNLLNINDIKYALGIKGHDNILVMKNLIEDGKSKEKYIQVYDYCEWNLLDFAKEVEAKRNTYILNYLQLFKGLKYLSTINKYAGDISVKNILIKVEDKVPVFKLYDFSPQHLFKNPTRNNKNYIAPEELKQELDKEDKYGIPTDIYRLSAILYWWIFYDKFPMNDYTNDVNGNDYQKIIEAKINFYKEKLSDYNKSDFCNKDIPYSQALFEILKIGLNPDRNKRSLDKIIELIPTEDPQTAPNEIKYPINTKGRVFNKKLLKYSSLLAAAVLLMLLIMLAFQNYLPFFHAKPEEKTIKNPLGLVDKNSTSSSNGSINPTQKSIDKQKESEISEIPKKDPSKISSRTVSTNSQFKVNNEPKVPRIVVPSEYFGPYQDSKLGSFYATVSNDGFLCKILWFNKNKYIDIPGNAPSENNVNVNNATTKIKKIVEWLKKNENDLFIEQ